MTTETTRPGYSIDTNRLGVHATRRRAVALTRWTTIGSLGLMACLWLAIFVSTLSVRDAALSRASADASNLSAALGEQVMVNLDTVNAATDLIARDFQADPAHFRLAPWTRQLSALTPAIVGLSVFDATGRLLASSGSSDSGGGTNVVAPPVGQSPGLHITVPETGAAGERRMIAVSTPLNDAAGRVAGSLVIDLARDRMTIPRHHVHAGAKDVLLLVGLDGRPIAWPDTKMNDAPSVWPLMANIGDTVTSDTPDGVSRIYAQRRLDPYPVIAVAGLCLDDELSEARMHAILVICIGVAASVLLATLNALLVREVRRRDQREKELADEHGALEAARTEILGEQGKLAAVNRELMLSKERAESANQAKSQFLAQMSHELRTPLHAVIGFSELIAHHVAPLPSGGQIASYAEDIMKSGRHLLELINSILDLSKVESGTASLDEDIATLGEVMTDSVTTIRERAHEAGVIVNVRLQRQPPKVRGDTTKLRQIFINLLSNAVKFTPRGGTVTVTGRLAPEGGFAVLVADTGIGMTEDEMQVAMEPFGQVENSLSRSFEGTGLGLPLARRMTELHGGRLTLSSAKGVGTTVEVWLPEARIIVMDQNVSVTSE